MWHMAHIAIMYLCGSELMCFIIYKYIYIFFKYLTFEKRIEAHAHYGNI